MSNDHRELEGRGGVTREETIFTHALTEADVMRAGEAVLMAIGTAVSLGHESPSGLMDYVPRPDAESDPVGRAVWDAFASTRMAGYADSRADLVRFACQRGVIDAVARAVAK